MSFAIPEGWQAVIGLEVHVQLNTATKIFCACPTTFGAAANTQVCPVCLGLPGALPVLNREVVDKAILLGLACGSAISERSVFARKNYFYPDLPKGYQITQADAPICVGGHIDVPAGDDGGAAVRLDLVRMHLEEDAGKSVHADAGRSLVDLNRAGVPLVEIVSEPGLTSPEQAAACLAELRALVRTLGVSDGNLEQGSLRCDANISVRRLGDEHLGTRCEIKNLNSFRSVRDAAAHEIVRQITCLQAGEAIIQQTRLWDTEAGRTRAMRSKEDAHDYRYFPDPDLPELHVEPARVARLRASLPELPAARRARLHDVWGIPAHLAASLSAEPERAAAWEAALGPSPTPERAVSFAHFLVGRVAGALNRSDRDSAEVLAAMPLIAEVHDRWRDGRLSNKMLADLLSAAFDTSAPLAISLRDAMDAAGTVVDDDAGLRRALDDALAAHPAQAQALRSGETKLIGFFVGQVMQALAGKADARRLTELLRAHVDS